MTEPVDMGTSAAPTSGPAPAPTGRRLSDVLWQNLYKYLLVVVLLAVVLIFSILRPQIFPTLNNLASILQAGRRSSSSPSPRCCPSSSTSST